MKFYFREAKVMEIMIPQNLKKIMKLLEIMIPKNLKKIKKLPEIMSQKILKEIMKLLIFPLTYITYINLQLIYNNHD